MVSERTQIARANIEARAEAAEHVAQKARIHSVLSSVSIDTLPDVLDAYSPDYGSGSNVRLSWLDGDKFPGGFGDTVLYAKDYWTLRARSIQLFNDNLYAYGIIKRLVTNEINSGLCPEATPDADILGMDPENLADWGEDVETRFQVWSSEPGVCDYMREDTFGELQYRARMDALIGGDILQICRVDPVTGAVNVQNIPGEAVCGYTDGSKLPEGHVIREGVQLDKNGRHFAYWYVDQNGDHQQILAYGKKTGRRVARLCYGCELRTGEVRGTPLLSRLLQSLREIDRYRDSALRKAVVNSTLAMFIKKTQSAPGSLPMTRGATSSKDVATASTDGGKSRFKGKGYLPGMIIDELQVGEEPVLKGGEGTDVNFGAFEEAMIQTMSWSNEMPPEIVRLAFSNNYSASQAAINEFKIYLNKVWATWGVKYCGPIYREWLVSEALAGRIGNAQQVLDAYRTPAEYANLGAWMSSEWYGQIKPSTDIVKQAKGSKILTAEGWSTNAREARITTGTKFSSNIKRLKRENAAKADAYAPIIEAHERAKAAGVEISAFSTHDADAAQSNEGSTDE